MDADLLKTKMMLTNAICAAKVEAEAELARVAEQLRDRQLVAESIADELGASLADVAARLAELTATVAELARKIRDLRARAGGGGAAPFDLDKLPAGDAVTTPTHVAVKQNGVWVKLSWGAFVDLLPRGPSSGDRWADDWADDWSSN